MVNIFFNSAFYKNVLVFFLQKHFCQTQRIIFSIFLILFVIDFLCSLFIIQSPFTCTVLIFFLQNFEIHLGFFSQSPAALGQQRTGRRRLRARTEYNPRNGEPSISLWSRRTSHKAVIAERISRDLTRSLYAACLIPAIWDVILGKILRRAGFCCLSHAWSHRDGQAPCL